MNAVMSPTPVEFSVVGDPVQSPGNQEIRRKAEAIRENWNAAERFLRWELAVQQQQSLLGNIMHLSLSVA